MGGMQPGNVLHMPDGGKRSMCRMDAGYWLGVGEDENFRRAELNLRRAIATYKRTLREKRVSHTRCEAMVREGEVRLCHGHDGVSAEAADSG